jgi:hypothetical protein
MDALKLANGAITITATTEAGEPKSYQLDLLILKLTCEEAEQENNLQVDREGPNAGNYRPTSAFLLDLSERIRGLGFDQCTPTHAMQLWNTASTMIEQLKKNIDQTPKSDSGTA